MKLSTRYSIDAKIAHVCYFDVEGSITFYTEDDEQIEIFGVKRDDMIRLARNYLVADLPNRTLRTWLTDHEVSSLKEIKDALDTYLIFEKN